jgi:hypothetical protein
MLHLGKAAWSPYKLSQYKKLREFEAMSTTELWVQSQADPC